MDLDQLLRSTAEHKASDLHLKVGSVPHIRVDGELHPLADAAPLSSEDMQGLAFQMMSEYQRRRFQETNTLDLAYDLEGLARFRANIFRQRGHVGMVLRLIPTNVPQLDQLNLPQVVENLCEERRGMVLVTGVTGSGKSTTLAAMINRINGSRPDHILTIEDPIEFIHRDHKGFVNQREIGVDAPNFASALRSALREDPDVILVGEMRDLETVRTALEAAETGHLVLSTLHTLDATETVQRIIAVFPLVDQKNVRMQLAATLKGVISQRLVKRGNGDGRVPAAEVMVSTEYIRECIINEDKTPLIITAIAHGSTPYGMQTFDQSLYDLHRRGLITLEEAFARATNPSELKLRIAGIRGASDAARDLPDQPVQVKRFGQT